MKPKIGDLSAPEPNRGRETVMIIIVVFLIVAAFALLVARAVFWNPAEPVVYGCWVDTAVLGVPSVDLCGLVPEAMRQKSNVVVTGGMSTFSTIIKIKDVQDTVFYNVLTPQQQIDTLVRTPAIVRSFEKYGFFGGALGGVILVLLLLVFFRLGKKVLQERKRAVVRRGRQEQVQQRKSSEKKELNFDSVA
jgi:hypothetical protein